MRMVTFQPIARTLVFLCFLLSIPGQSFDGMEPKKRKVESSSSRPSMLSLSQKKYVSANALASILQSIDKDGMPSAISASTYARQRKKATHRDTPLGNMIYVVSAPLIAGSDVDLPLRNPYALLHVAPTDDLGYRRVFDMFVPKTISD